MCILACGAVLCSSDLLLVALRVGMPAARGCAHCVGLSVCGCDASLDVCVFFGRQALQPCLQYGQGDPQCFGGVVVDALVILDECWRELFHGDEELGGSEFDGAFFEDGGSCVEWHRARFNVADLVSETARSEERRVGKEGVSKCKSRG